MLKSFIEENIKIYDNTDMATIDELKKVRLEKLDALRKLGVNPYPSSVVRDHTIDQALVSDGKKVAVVGRILRMRGHGKIFFWDITDESGSLQLVIKADSCENNSFALTEFVDLGDFISAQGLIGKTQAGEVSLFVETFQIITKTLLPLPDHWHGFKDVEDRYRKRYLDILLNPEVKKRLYLRSKIIDAIRDFMTDRSFIEVETPTLQPVYGGGFARPFATHHNELESDLYLRISDEMYLKRLIVGGFEKVFEITKVFRNEGVDHDHNPEFTMFEAMTAYTDYAYGMDIIEEIIEYAAKQTLGTTVFTYQGVQMDVKRPWSRFRMVEAIQKFTGIDPLAWKDIQSAKEAIQKVESIPQEKFKILNALQSIGECISFLFEEAVESQLIQPTIVYDYPIETSPLAKKCNDPRFTQRFEMFAFGSELGNNYTELNDPVDLRKRFIEEKKREEAGFDEAHQTDYDYLEAIEHGFPPTCGIAIGIDRLVMLFSDAKSIKEVIPFPTLRSQQKMKQSVEAKEVVNTISLPDEKGMRFIAILRKDVESGRLMNALGHMTAGLAGGFDKAKEMCFLQYKDKDDGLHPNISHFPFIVLKADNTNQIRTVRDEAIKRGIIFTDFTSTMTVGTSKDQVVATRASHEKDLEYFGICLFGKTFELREFTKKFSLFT